MAKFAFVFPGQGAQHPGMGKDLAENYDAAASIFAQADKILDYSISSLCFEGPKDQLNQTEYAQPALLLSSLAAFEVLQAHGIHADALAGLSLGEYTALAASAAISLEDALPLVQTRGRLMQNAVPAGRGAMAAILGSEEKVVQEACEHTQGTVAIANYNCPGQLVISGEKEPVLLASEQLKASGARVVPLAVSVPSHSRLMYDAAKEFEPYLERIPWKESQLDVISNVNARENSAQEFTDLLVRQLFSPVRWEQSVRYILEKVDYIIEVGPGKTLSGLINKIDRSRLLGQVNDQKSLEKVIEKVKSL